jgi:hypothetical protein
MSEFLNTCQILFCRNTGNSDVFLHFFPFITEGNSFYVRKSASTVIAGADKNYICQANGPTLGNIKGPIKKILEHPRHIPEIFRRTNGDCLTIQQVLDSRIPGFFQDDRDILFLGSALRKSKRHAFHCSLLRMIDNQNIFLFSFHGQSPTLNKRNL